MLDFLKSHYWSLDKLAPPWESGTSIYLYLRDNPNSRELPDTSRNPNELKWSGGALDGVFGRHMAGPKPDEIKKRVEKLAGALERLMRDATDSNLKSLYEAAVEGSTLAIADSFNSRVTKLLSSQKTRIGQVGRYFAAEADRREATKFGLLLLERTGARVDETLLETFALNDEFTLFAALALAHLTDDAEGTFFKIARRVHGWGRIQVVERLNGTRNREIHAWMLREGFRNEVMDDYLAGICARTASLHLALDPPEVDLPLLDGAAAIIRALLAGGPADSIDDYEHAPIAIERYVDHVFKRSGLDLEHFLCVSAILDFLSDKHCGESSDSIGWNEKLRKQIRAQCSEVICRDEWRDKVASGLQSQNLTVFYSADSVAAKMNIGTREFHFSRVRSAPLTSHSWYRLLEQTDENQIDEVITFAESVLPLEKIATGPDNHLGLGPGYEAHSALDWMLQGLKRFPGRGWELIRAGLRSPVVRNRNMALHAFSAWPRDLWPSEALGLLQQAAREEPNANVRVRIEQAIRSN